MTSTQYLLGGRADAPPELAAFAKMSHGSRRRRARDRSRRSRRQSGRSHASRRTRCLSTCRAHSTVIQSSPPSWPDRARAISTEPARDAVILVAHGPVNDAENQQCLTNLGAFAGGVRTSAAYSSIDWLTVMATQAIMPDERLVDWIKAQLAR